MRQLTSLLKEDSTNVSRELTRLEKAGVLILSARGKHKYYQANTEYPIYHELKSIITKTFGVADVIHASLKPTLSHIRAAFIFGSVATGSERKTSDIDIMIIGDISFENVVYLVASAEAKLGREINPVVYSVDEFRKRADEQNHFVKRTLGEEKIFIIGDENELKRLGE